MAVLLWPLLLLKRAFQPTAVLLSPVVLFASAEKPMAVLLWPVVFCPAPTPKNVSSVPVGQLAEHCARACDESVNHAKAQRSGMRRNRSRTDERLIEFPMSEVLVFINGYLSFPR